MAFAHLGRKLAVDSLTLGLAYSLDRPAVFPMDAGIGASGTSTEHDPGVYVGGWDRYGPGACSGTRAICVDELNGAAFTLSMGAPMARGAFRGPDQITIGARTVSGDSRAVRLKFQSQAKFFNPFNRVNFRSARRRSRPSRNKEGFRTTRLARGMQAGERSASASLRGNRGARMVRPVKLRLKTAPNLI